MTVRGVDRYPERGQGLDLDAVWGTERLPELLDWSDFVVIAAPHTPETERLFDAAMIGHMKPTAYLINIGRGAIVVLDDLVAAIQDRKIAGAALDVYEVEPLPNGASAVGISERDFDAAHSRLFTRDRETAPGHAGRKPATVPPG